MGSAGRIETEGGDDSGNVQLSILNLRQRLEEDPGDARAQLRLGCLLSELDCEQALVAFREALSLSLTEGGREGEDVRREATQRLIQVMHRLER